MKAFDTTSISYRPAAGGETFQFFVYKKLHSSSLTLQPCHIKALANIVDA